MATHEGPRNHPKDRTGRMVSNQIQRRTSPVQASRQARSRHGSRNDERRAGQKDGKEHSQASRPGQLTDRPECPMETYLLVIGKTATGYSARCPDVPGCAAVGKTVEEVAENMKKALEFH